MRTSPSPRAFTLIELLVVISIIVILLALLVGGLERALKAAERAKCGTQQRSLGQNCATYALEYDRTFPSATNATNSATVAVTAMDMKLANGTAPNYADTEVGL